METGPPSTVAKNQDVNIAYSMLEGGAEYNAKMAMAGMTHCKG
jgi:hypothetical protein